MNPCVSCTSTFYQVATLGARRTDDGGAEKTVSSRIRSYGFGRSLWISEEASGCWFDKKPHFAFSFLRGNSVSERTFSLSQRHA